MHYEIETNGKYQMNHQVLPELVQHLYKLLTKYSKVIPLRMDFGYRRSAIYRHPDDWDIYRLAEELMRDGKIVGYSWVMEYSPLKQHHFHVMFYLDGQSFKSSYRIARYIGERWVAKTQGEGIYHISNKKPYHQVSGTKMIHHNDRERQREIEYILSYMAKADQKEEFEELIYGTSIVPPSSGRGRPRKSRKAEEILRKLCCSQSSQER
ncbi:inovirus-type Gp2 protein [Escherichia fergusonii]|nr:inovirus-type Gp2 protein [Escherichia fergusonii]MBA8268873.1 inovirus-type Gp2 protein [Escherichia fergusonii]